MNDDLANLDIDDGLDEIDNNIQDTFNPDTYVKPYLGPNGEPEPDIQKSESDEQEEKEDDLLTAFLKSKGIKDSTIKIELEDGTIEEKDFNDLSREEQLEILNSNDSTPDPLEDLDNEEIDLLNSIRENGLSVQEYLDWIKQQAIEDYVNQVNEEYSRIDTLTDEEIFLLDLQSMNPDITQEEALSALEYEKNSALWDKKVQGLRQRYKDLEKAEIESQEAANEEENNRKALEIQNSIQETVNNFNSIGEFDIEDEDKEEIAELIFGVDKTGTRYLARYLSDPETLVKMAWFALKGEEALETISSYYKDQIDQYSKDNYKKGFEDGKNGKQQTKPTSKTTVVKKNNKSNNDNEGVQPLFSPYMIDLD